MAKKLGKIEPKKVKAETISGNATEKAEEAKEVEESEWKENLVAFAIVAIVVIAIYGIFIAGWFSQPVEPIVEEKLYQISTYDRFHLGADNAPVTVVEFSDYKCPSCTWFQRTLFPKLKSEYIDTGKVRFVYRDFPLESTHQESKAIAKAANCAGEQGFFWEFHDSFYKEEVNEELISSLIAQYDMNETKMILCRNSDAAGARIEQDIVGGINEGGVAATPTFFINGKKLVGSGEEGEFFADIDSALGNATG